MKRRLAVKPRLTMSAYEPIRPCGASADASLSATCQGQRPYHPGFEAANLRLRVKISRVLRDFHARFVGLMPKTQEISTQNDWHQLCNWSR
jgi:hypothetical protein